MTTTNAPRVRRRRFESYATALRFLEERPNVERTRQSRVDPDAFKLDRKKALAAFEKIKDAA